MNPRFWAVLLAAIGAAERAALRLIYSPVAFGDTPSYLRLAEALDEAGLAGYDATRVPGYPLFLLALGGDPQRVWLAQMALGWAISLLLFWIGWRTTRSARFGFALGMLYNLIPGLVLFEANLLSETLTAFCVILSLALLVSTGPSHPKPLQLLALGAAASLTGLVRALFYPLAPWVGLFVGCRRARRWRRLALYAVLPALLLGGWVGYVYTQYGMLSPTTMSGYHLVQHTGEYFELLPDRHAAIRDTYLKYRQARIAERGVQTNAIWDAIPELSQVSGLSFFGLSAELQRLSLQLILAHPGRYLANVVQGWIDFWKAPAIWEPAALQLAGLEGIFGAWALAGRALSLAANAAFLTISVLALAAGARSLLTRIACLGGGPPEPARGPLSMLANAAALRIRTCPLAVGRLPDRLGLDSIFFASAGLVWLTSIVQTLVDHGDNPRFLVPLQMVVIYVVLRAGFRWFTAADDRT